MHPTPAVWPQAVPHIPITGIRSLVNRGLLAPVTLATGIPCRPPRSHQKALIDVLPWAYGVASQLRLRSLPSIAFTTLTPTQKPRPCRQTVLGLHQLPQLAPANLLTRPSKCFQRPRVHRPVSLVISVSLEEIIIMVIMIMDCMRRTIPRGKCSPCSTKRRRRRCSLPLHRVSCLLGGNGLHSRAR